MRDGAGGQLAHGLPSLTARTHAPRRLPVHLPHLHINHTTRPDSRRRRRRRRRRSEPLRHPPRDVPHLGVDLPGRRAHDERAQRVARNLDVGEGPEDVDLVVSEHDARPRRVLDREFRLAALRAHADSATV